MCREHTQRGDAKHKPASIADGQLKEFSIYDMLVIVRTKSEIERRSSGRVVMSLVSSTGATHLVNDAPPPKRGRYSQSTVLGGNLEQRKVRRKTISPLRSLYHYDLSPTCRRVIKCHFIACIGMVVLKRGIPNHPYHSSLVYYSTPHRDLQIPWYPGLPSQNYLPANSNYPREKPSSLNIQHFASQAHFDPVTQA